MTGCATLLKLDFYRRRPLTVEFSDLDLSSDAGILLARQAEERLQICQGLSECIQEWRDPDKITHSLYQLVSQRIYQMVGGYEDASDSNFLRHDPIYKIACERLPIPSEELLASQPTISRMENHVNRQEVGAIRRLFVERFIASYQKPPSEVILDIDGWDDPTHGQQELSRFHGYYGHHNVLPVNLGFSNWANSLSSIGLVSPISSLKGFLAIALSIFSHPNPVTSQSDSDRPPRPTHDRTFPTGS